MQDKIHNLSQQQQQQAYHRVNRLLSTVSVAHCEGEIIKKKKEEERGRRVEGKKIKEGREVCDFGHM